MVDAVRWRRRWRRCSVSIVLVNVAPNWLAANNSYKTLSHRAALPLASCCSPQKTTMYVYLLPSHPTIPLTLMPGYAPCNPTIAFTANYLWLRQTRTGSEYALPTSRLSIFYETLSAGRPTTRFDSRSRNIDRRRGDGGKLSTRTRARVSVSLYLALCD